MVNSNHYTVTITASTDIRRIKKNKGPDTFVAYRDVVFVHT
jgi:hypothetical protein